MPRSVRRFVAAAALALGMAMPAQAFDKWDKTDKGLAVAFTTFSMIDYGQTRYIAKNPDKFYEKWNCFLLGEHPSPSRVTKHFALSYTGAMLVAHVLPSRWRKVWLSAATALEVTMAVNNYAIGIKVRF